MADARRSGRSIVLVRNFVEQLVCEYLRIAMCSARLSKYLLVLSLSLVNCEIWIPLFELLVCWVCFWNSLMNDGWGVYSCGSLMVLMCTKRMGNKLEVNLEISFLEGCLYFLMK
ncbi:hypothetical protein BT93_C0732 [Corymbia citriodora subsp. variegata]|nr:hypothetical protein BT93_C0732 [Corymbia citriodora subsp. variegata]